LGIVIDMGGVLVTPESGTSVGLATGVGLGVLVVGWHVYDALWKAMSKKEPVGVAISVVLLAGASFGLSQVMTGRAVFIHIGSLLGTLMAANVWFRIWPSQRKIIGAIKEGQAPDAALVAMAGFRSKQNTYMSVPLTFMMVSNHFPTVYGHDLGWLLAIVFVLVGWGATKWLFQKSASPAPTKI